MTSREELWTIGQLGTHAADALATDYQASSNGQVSAVPDARSIRYYSTLGLVDKPSEMRGRTAYYDHHHLLQLVAIKRLQAKGYSLAEVQESLSGLSDDRLEAIALIPARSALREASTRASSPTARPSRGESFWTAPLPDAEQAPRPARSNRPATRSTPSAAPRAQHMRVQSQLKLELAPGVHLTVDTQNIPNQADQERLAQAAESLLDALRACGLQQPPSRRWR